MACAYYTYTYRLYIDICSAKTAQRQYAWQTRHLKVRRKLHNAEHMLVKLSNPHTFSSPGGVEANRCHSLLLLRKVLKSRSVVVQRCSRHLRH